MTGDLPPIEGQLRAEPDGVAARESAPADQMPQPDDELAAEIIGESVLERLAYNPAIDAILRKLPELIGSYMENNAAVAKAKVEHEAALARAQVELNAAGRGRATWSILGATVALALIVVGPATWLTQEGKLSPDAATFLFGAIVGAAFTFLRDFFPRQG